MRLSERKVLSVACSNCGHTTRVPIQRFYDGYEGMFVCSGCGEPLENLFEALDSE